MTSGSRFAWATNWAVVVAFWFKNAFKSGLAIADATSIDNRQTKPATLQNNTILLFRPEQIAPMCQLTKGTQDSFQTYSSNGSWATSLALRALSINSNASL